MESKRNDSVQNLFFSFFKQPETDTNKEKAAIVIQNWWKQNQWKRFYTIPETDRLDTDVISTECNIGDLEYNYYVNKRKFVDSDTDEADDEADDEANVDDDEVDGTDDTSIYLMLNQTMKMKLKMKLKMKFKMKLNMKV